MKKRKHSTSPLYSKGQLNRLIDDLIHPLFKKGKGFVILDGLLHSAIEQNPPLSVKKFIKFNLHELLDNKRLQQKRLKSRKRHYSCVLPTNNRFIFCRFKKAGPWCLTHNLGRQRCPQLVIKYK